MVVYTKEQVLALTQNQFTRLEPNPEKPLCFHGFTGEFDETYREVLSYVRSLLNGPLRDEIGSPIFNFVLEEDMARLSPGAKKWVGIIPREMAPAAVQELARIAADTIALHEGGRLGIEKSDLDLLQRTVHNALIATLHYGLKAAPEEKTLNLALEGRKNFISYKELEEKLRALDSGEETLTRAEMDAKLIQLLKELDAIPADADAATAQETLTILGKAKSEAWTLYKELDRSIQKAQKLANAKGPLAEVDLDDEHPSLHFYEHLRAIYGLSKEYGQTTEDRYELQTAGNLTWLMARLTTHPVYKNLIKYKDQVEQSFLKKVYHHSGLFAKNPVKKVIYLDERMRPSTEALHQNTWDPQVYDSLLAGFDDLKPEQKQVYRAGFRDKKPLALLVKTIRDRQELVHISDALAGEAVMTGIHEKDLDPEKNPETAERLQAFMIAQAEAVAASMGLTKAPEGVHYTKIPKGTYKVVAKLEKSKKEHSFNFPAVKIYLNIPVDDDPEGESIRTEYRFVCQDTWLRANKQEDSMSHHGMYKLKQEVDLLDIHTARAYNDTIHKVANRFRDWVKIKETMELIELKTAQRSNSFNAF